MQQYKKKVLEKILAKAKKKKKKRQKRKIHKRGQIILEMSTK